MKLIDRILARFGYRRVRTYNCDNLIHWPDENRNLIEQVNAEFERLQGGTPPPSDV